MVDQFQFSLKPYPRGFHLITSEVIAFLKKSSIQNGVVHLFVHHTSAGLTINENADPTVRTDFESFINQLVPENEPYFLHNYEGADDMPAHIKASLFGCSVSFPIANGRALLGTWQGIYLCEHRNHGGSRRFTLTIIGEE
jgi:secondary thiamine-phosphate synthase enzyme